jgi:hypothetical protein
MNQVSPRVFEAVAVRTALVLFEGKYSGVVEPDTHFIPLRKDFGNIDEVLAKVQDDSYLEALTARAHRDVIGSGNYSYRTFVGAFDQTVGQRVPGSNGCRLVLEACGYFSGRQEALSRGCRIVSKPIDFADLDRQRTREIRREVLRRLPGDVGRALKDMVWAPNSLPRRLLRPVKHLVWKPKKVA